MNCIWQVIQSAGTRPLGRSSHSINVINKAAYVFGGEHEPRVPIGSAVWRLDVTSAKWQQLQTTGLEVPPRNAHASAVVGSSIYIFGGRRGVAMGEGSLSDMYKLDTVAGAWNEVIMTGDIPEARSYHSMASIGPKLYVFGGCTESGRLNDLHEFDSDSGKWTQLPTSDNIVARGGAGFTAVGQKLYVVGGFTGEEIGDVHEFDTELAQWREVEVTRSLPPRSVCGVASLGSRIFVIGGEVDPSSSGHAGAGQFSDEIYVLDTEDEESGWEKLKASSDVKMSPRGWFPATKYDSNTIILFGGSALDNSRLDDTFLLHFSQ